MIAPANFTNKEALLIKELQEETTKFGKTVWAALDDKRKAKFSTALGEQLVEDGITNIASADMVLDVAGTHERTTVSCLLEMSGRFKFILKVMQGLALDSKGHGLTKDMFMGLASLADKAGLLIDEVNGSKSDSRPSVSDMVEELTTTKMPSLDSKGNLGNVIMLVMMNQAVDTICFEMAVAVAAAIDMENAPDEQDLALLMDIIEGNKQAAHASQVMAVTMMESLRNGTVREVEDEEEDGK